MRLLKYVAPIALVLCVSCHALTPLEKEHYDNLIRQGAQPVKPKNPFMAGGLNFLPGFGDHYNNGKEEPFWLDLALWPLGSPLWAVPQGLFTAMNLNKRATLEYYTTGEGSNQGFDPEVSEAAPLKINP